MVVVVVEVGKGAGVGVQWFSPSPLYSTFMAGYCTSNRPEFYHPEMKVCALRAFSADARSPDAPLGTAEKPVTEWGNV